ncbi:putative MFS family arabinose efflux permease [Litoreibacter ponti]|uniref:Putative MFS family arabinose efflux permease n=1 Tax=Litoreibacter ponti TaxID=1510457 RepID=A0A2T6BK77_9RHOB|nr:MFS transporter [Litoreibacter ponti]PTX56464.1 putative MFS family arabinose efflux permease [Litoreibacter ponti]
MSEQTVEEAAFARLVENPDSSQGLTEAANADEPHNALRHVASLTASKVADGLVDPKLVLSWLLTSLGSPAFYVGLLVPIREAGALLPQLALAPWIEAMAQRKWAWVAGAAGQALGAFGILISALTLSGAAAGAAICACLAVLALSRSVCSVSYKDVLGKTVAEQHRGSITGTASTIASAGVIVFALLLMSGLLGRELLVFCAIGLAACLWAIGSTMFATLREQDSEGASDDFEPLKQFHLLKSDPQLTRFIAVRGLLVATALAPPYMLLFAGSEGAFSQLGALVLASSLASFASSYVWGRLSDRSSRRVLQYSGLAGGASLLLTLALGAAGLLSTIWALPLSIFALMIAYHGVRQGRSTYLVDMAPEDKRSAYTAVSNTVIGVLLLISGGFGALAGLVGAGATLAAFALMSFAAAALTLGLDEVEGA